MQFILENIFKSNPSAPHCSCCLLTLWEEKQTKLKRIIHQARRYLKRSPHFISVNLNWTHFGGLEWFDADDVQTAINETGADADHPEDVRRCPPDWTFPQHVAMAKTDSSILIIHSVATLTFRSYCKHDGGYFEADADILRTELR